jgi:hypothetical protein
MWKANVKTTTLSFFLDSLFPKIDTIEEILEEDGKVTPAASY